MIHRPPGPIADLHLHTTASDGRSTPAELVEQIAAAGLQVMAVTDHDTTAAVRETQELARQKGIESIPGIEITASENGRDVHVLGYFLDPDHAGLNGLLETARTSRIARLRGIAERLNALGLPVDVDAILASAGPATGRSVGRPLIARAMVAAGYVRSTSEAFDRWLGQNGPAFVPRAAVTPEEVIAVIHGAGGLASLAHPGRTRIDDRLPALRDAGLDAIEAFHSDHDARTAAGYADSAQTLGLLVTGGSDFHGDPTHGVSPGAAGLALDDWQRLSAARHRHAAH